MGLWTVRAPFVLLLSPEDDKKAIRKLLFGYADSHAETHPVLHPGHPGAPHRQNQLQHPERVPGRAATTNTSFADFDTAELNMFQ